MKVLSFFTNRIAVTYLVAGLLSVLATFHVVLPASVNAASLTTVILLGAAVVAAVLRFGHPGEPGADAKVWWQSKTIITQTVAVAFALFALMGFAPVIEQARIVDGVLGVVALLSMFFGATVNSPIAGSAADPNSY